MSEAIPNNHAKVLAQEPVEISFDVRPLNWRHKLLMRYFPKLYPPKKSYSISPITSGNLERISDILLSIQVDLSTDVALRTAYILMKNHAKDVSRICAIALANTRQGPNNDLIEDLHWNLTSQELLAILNIVLKQMDVQGFLSTIILISALDVRDKGKKNETPNEAPDKMSPQVPGNTLVP